MKPGTGRPKPKRVSKHKKKGWKTIDSTELEDFLEERAIEERTGGIISAKKDRELFFVDKNKYTIENGDKSYRKNRKLKCHSILEPDSRIPTINLGKSNKSHELKRLHPSMKKRFLDKSEKADQNEIETYKKRDLKRYESKKRSLEIDVKNFDLWKDEPVVLPEAGEDLIQDITVQKPVKIPKKYCEKPSAVPAIVKPHPGMSYNPAYDDHQKLLGKALKIERKKKEKEDEIEKETISLTVKIQEKDKRKDKKEESEDEEISDEDLDCTGINPAVRREDRKSFKHKEHDRNVKLRARQKNALKSIRMRESEVFRIKSFNKEFKVEDLKSEKKKTKKNKLEAKQIYKTKRLGRAKFVAADIDLQLGKEISGSLRRLKPEGNMMSDRYKSYQKRNIIPPSKGVHKPKLPKVKFYEKRGHREISEQAGVHYN